MTDPLKHHGVLFPSFRLRNEKLKHGEVGVDRIERGVASPFTCYITWDKSY